MTICDLGSRNGTLVNDQRIEGQFALKTGDRLAIGQLKFEVNLTTGLKAAKQPVVKDVKDAAMRTREHKSSGDMDVDTWLQSGDPTGGRCAARFSGVDPQRASVTETSAGIDAETIIARTAKPAETPAPDHTGPKTPGKLPCLAAAADGRRRSGRKSSASWRNTADWPWSVSRRFVPAPFAAIRLSSLTRMRRPPKVPPVHPRY